MGDSPKQGVTLSKNYTKDGKGGHGLPLGLVGGLTLTTEFQTLSLSDQQRAIPPYSLIMIILQTHKWTTVCAISRPGGRVEKIISVISLVSVLAFSAGLFMVFVLYYCHGCLKLGEKKFLKHKMEKILMDLFSTNKIHLFKVNQIHQVP